MQSFIRRACIEFNDYFDYMFREKSEVSGIWNPLLKNTQWFPEYWPYSWLSPHSLILLASCWAFFFSRQALKTEENKTLSFFRLCASIPILHMTPLLSQLAHAFQTMRKIENLFNPSEGPFDTTKGQIQFWFESVGKKGSENKTINACQILMPLMGTIFCNVERISLFIQLWVS